MLRFIVRIIGATTRFIFWDSDRIWQERKHRGQYTPSTSNTRGPIHVCKAGNIVGRVYLNHSAYGKPYFKTQFQTQMKNGRLSTSFHVKDHADLKRCVDMADMWCADSKAA